VEDERLLWKILGRVGQINTNYLLLFGKKVFSYVCADKSRASRDKYQEWFSIDAEMYYPISELFKSFVDRFLFEFNFTRNKRLSEDRMPSMSMAQGLIKWRLEISLEESPDRTVAWLNSSKALESK
jgi:hypothetical protein